MGISIAKSCPGLIRDPGEGDNGTVIIGAEAELINSAEPVSIVAAPCWGDWATISAAHEDVG